MSLFSFPSSSERCMWPRLLVAYVEWWPDGKCNTHRYWNIEAYKNKHTSPRPVVFGFWLWLETLLALFGLYCWYSVIRVLLKPGPESSPSRVLRKRFSMVIVRLKMLLLLLLLRRRLPEAEPECWREWKHDDDSHGISACLYFEDLGNEGRRIRSQGEPYLHRKFEVNWDSMRPYLKQTNSNKRRWGHCSVNKVFTTQIRGPECSSPAPI